MMNFSGTCCLIVSLLFVLTVAAPAQPNKLTGQISTMLSSVGTVYQSISSMFDDLKQSATDEKAHVSQLTADVRQLEFEKKTAADEKAKLTQLTADVRQLELEKQKTANEKAKLSQLTADVRQLEFEKQKTANEKAKLSQTTADLRRLSDSLKQALSKIERMKGSLAELKAMQPVCGKTWTRRGAKCYKLDRCTDQPHCTINKSRDKCRQQGAELANVRSAGDNAFVASLASGKGKFRNLFIGARDDATEGRWLWADGSHLTYTNWNTGQPDNYKGHQDCALIWLFRKNTWDDAGCNHTYSHADTGYVCEKHIWG